MACARARPQTVVGPSRLGPGGGVERSLATASRPLAPATWRLLTGHENGQLLLWHPRASVLAPLIRIGEPASSVRGIHVFDDVFGIVVTAHQDGTLQFFMQLRADNMVLPPGSESMHPDSLGTFRPKKMVIKVRGALADSAGGAPSARTFRAGWNAGIERRELWAGGPRPVYKQQRRRQHRKGWRCLRAGMRDKRLRCCVCCVCRRTRATWSAWWAAPRGSRRPACR